MIVDLIYGDKTIGKNVKKAAIHWLAILYINMETIQ